MNDGIRMQISAFVDGELPENEAELLLRRLSQDSELRMEVAEYLALGRLIRAEAGLAGADGLHERIAAEIDERPADASNSAVKQGAARFMRPLAGFAIAASVALAAIFTLQQTAIVDEAADVLPQAMVAGEVQPGVPSMDAQLERQRSIFRRHAETSSRYGASAINSEVVDLRFSEEIVADDSLKQLQQDVIDAGDSEVETVQP
jgi:negative regulator of sigma E activity